jgi:hypothetical protein
LLGKPTVTFVGVAGPLLSAVIDKYIHTNMMYIWLYFADKNSADTYISLQDKVYFVFQSIEFIETLQTYS